MNFTNKQTLLASFFLPQGVRKGDRVSIYLPMIPELVYTMLACARIGAVHSVVVGSTINFLELCFVPLGETDMWSIHVYMLKYTRYSIFRINFYTFESL